MTPFDAVTASVTAALPALAQLAEGAALPNDSPATPLDTAYAARLMTVAREIGYEVVIQNTDDIDPKRQNAEGLTNTQARVITLHPRLLPNASRYWRVLLHELTHAVIGETARENINRRIMTVCRFVAADAGELTFDPFRNRFDEFKAMLWSMAHTEHVKVGLLKVEEMVVELACGMAQHRLGVDYRFASHYLAQFVNDATLLAFVREEAEGLADRFVEILSHVEETALATRPADSEVGRGASTDAGLAAVA